MWTGLAIVSAAAFYLRVLCPWHMNWGATEAEAHGAVAGDDLRPGAGIVSTRVVEIQAQPSAIWPWLVQMGPGRGGADTYDWIERRLGIDIRNVDRIVPELQDLAAGDEIEMPGYKMWVERLDKEKAMVVRSSNEAWLWAFELRPTDGHTRLISRNSFDTAKLRRQDWARVSDHRAGLMGPGAQDAAHHQAARRDPRPKPKRRKHTVVTSRWLSAPRALLDAQTRP